MIYEFDGESAVSTEVPPIEEAIGLASAGDYTLLIKGFIAAREVNAFAMAETKRSMKTCGERLKPSYETLYQIHQYEEIAISDCIDWLSNH